MPSIVIFVHDIGTEPDTGNAIYKCKMRIGGMTDVTGDELFELPVPMNALPETVNSSIKNQAVSQCEGNGFGTVQVNDKITVVGGAVGL